MISQLQIRNFKSIQNADLDLGKITVLTGANNSGKSSFIYALLVLRNIVNNPNQSIDNFLTLPFINLGGFEQSVFDKNKESNIELGVTLTSAVCEVKYNIQFNPQSSLISLCIEKPIPEEHHIEVAFPYPVNKNNEYTVLLDGENVKYRWNGFYADASNPTPLMMYSLLPFQLPINTFSEVDFVPIRRGFTEPYYGTIPLQQQISTEKEIATLLANDHDLEKKVAYYLEKIVDKFFAVYFTQGTANFYLRTIDKKTGFASELVNEGLGTNQLVTILAKVLYNKSKFICIDEPEIHLHPTIIDKLVSVLIEIAEQEGKQFLVSTHSEHVITSLLNSVVKNDINNDDVKVYYLAKEGKATKVERQQINEYGQIEGGLKNFYASEVDNLKTLFKIAQ